MAQCPLQLVMAWGVLLAGMVGATTSDGDMRLDRWFVRWMTASAPSTAFPGRCRLDTTEEARGLSTPAQVDVWIGLDVGKEEHFAEVLDNDGERLFARSR